MAQGTLKKKAAAPAKKANTRHKAAKVKKGARSIAPKQATRAKDHARFKKLTGKSNNNVERQLAVKANAIGKLTIMKKIADQAAATGTTASGKSSASAAKKKK